MMQWGDGRKCHRSSLKCRIHRAERLQRDWYYGHAQFEDCGAGEVRMTFGENDQDFVFELLRWLGTGAELIEPQAWREAFRDELRAMLTAYEE